MTPINHRIDIKKLAGEWVFNKKTQAIESTSDWCIEPNEEDCVFTQLRIINLKLK